MDKNEFLSKATSYICGNLILKDAMHFSFQFLKKKLPDIPKLPSGAIDDLMEYHWPGNVRELQNVIERALILNPTGPSTFSHLNPKNPQKAAKASQNHDVTDNLDDVICRQIRRVLTKTHGKTNGPDGAAALLGINPSTLRHRMKKLGIDYGKRSEF